MTKRQTSLEICLEALRRSLSEAGSAAGRGMAEPEGGPHAAACLSMAMMHLRTSERLLMRADIINGNLYKDRQDVPQIQQGVGLPDSGDIGVIPVVSCSSTDEQAAPAITRLEGTEG